MKLLLLAATLISSTSAIAAAEAPAPAAAPQADPAKIVRPDVQAMSMSEIRRFNTTVPSKHPYFIVCRQAAVTGSLAQVRRTCNTREDWERRTREAQNTAQGLLDGGRASSGCNPYCLENQPGSAPSPQ